jgi:predicted nucleotidyltransferase component of viral defense system
MITRLDIEERVREWGLREDVVEKDYVIGWVLWGIGADEALSTSWAFKGGTSLKKCYLETYRFSEDLDFTVLPGGPIRAEELSPILLRVLERVHQQSGIVFTDRAPVFKTHISGNYTEGRVYYRGPRNTPGVASLKIDLSASEKVARPTVLQEISHAYPDKLPTPGTVRCYSFDEVFAEKIRAMGERSRPRDLYDIINLFRRDDLRSQPDVRIGRRCWPRTAMSWKFITAIRWRNSASGRACWASFSARHRTKSRTRPSCGGSSWT